MSKVFYDHLILIEEVGSEIDLLPLDKRETHQAKKLIDDMMHHRVLGFILDCLPRQHHEEFLDRFSETPFDLTLLDYLEMKIKRDIKSELVLLGNKLKRELLAEIKKHRQ